MVAEVKFDGKRAEDGHAVSRTAEFKGLAVARP
jgi:hypothetical protein